ncbi:MAG: PEGA domain-containing protein [Candidatus Omnitrophota bacterium]|jgi:hypothetical protein
MINFRKCLFYTITLFYAVMCPVLILYALGYIFAPHIDEGLVKTGLIHLESLPSKAVIRIDHRLQPDRTPATLSDLLPGFHEVEVSSPGYRPWSQRVEVFPGKASIYDQILLVTSDTPSRVLAPGPFKNIVAVPAAKLLILLGGGSKLSEAAVFDLKDHGLVPLFSDPSAWAGAEVEGIDTVTSSSSVLIRARRGSGKIYLWCDLSKKRPEVRDISVLVSAGPPGDFDWDPREHDLLYTYRQGEVSAIHLREASVRPVIARNVSAFGLWERGALTVQSGAVVRYEPGRKKFQGEVLETGEAIAALFPEGKTYRMRVLGDDLALFLGAQGELMANRLPYRFADHGVLGVDITGHGEKVVFWTRERIGVLDFSKARTRKRFFETGPRVEWIFEAGKQIRRVFWVNEGSHVLYDDEGALWLREAVQTAGAAAERLASVKADASVAYMEETGDIFFLHPKTGALETLGLLPKEKLLGLSLAPSGDVPGRETP